MVIAKLLGLAPRGPTRKDLTEQSAQVRAEIEKLTREISADAIRRARESAAKMESPSQVTTS